METDLLAYTGFPEINDEMIAAPAATPPPPQSPPSSTNDRRQPRTPQQPEPEQQNRTAHLHPLTFLVGLERDSWLTARHGGQG